MTYSPNGAKPEVDFPGYQPELMLERLGKHLQVRSDLQLSAALGINPSMLSKVRKKRLPIGASLLVRIHELTGWPTREIRAIYGDRRDFFRLPKETLSTRTTHNRMEVVEPPLPVRPADESVPFDRL